MKAKVVTTPGFLVACMSCHNGKPTEVDTHEQALKEAQIHLSIDSGHKSHAGHVVAITPVELVRREK